MSYNSHIPDNEFEDTNYGMMSSMMAAQDTDAIDPEDNERYLLFFSSQKCIHSKKMQDYFNKNPLDKHLSQKIEKFDIIADFYHKRMRPPDYIVDVPTLIIASKNANDIISVIRGEPDVIQWYNSKLKQKRKPFLVGGGGNTVGVNKDATVTNKSWVNRIPKGKNGKNKDDQFGAEFFQEKVETKGTGRVKDFNDQLAEYNKANEELGLTGADAPVSEKLGGVTGDFEPQRIRASNTAGNTGGSLINKPKRYESKNGSKKIGAFNA